MILRHATPRQNLSGIRQAGLLCGKSRCRLPVVWLHSPGRSSCAVLHVAKRHRVTVEEVAVLEISVPRSWLRCSPRRGLLVCPRDVPSWRIKRQVGVEEIAA